MKPYNPVVLICSHHRIEVTAQNIASLNMQEPKPTIILIVSDVEEYLHFEYFSNRLDNLHVYVRKNTPLGSKWQHGTEMAKCYNPNPLIITGSDDFLARDFIKNACKLIDQGYHFIGLRRWFVYDPNKSKVYLFDYKPEQPLGGGRVYSNYMLEKINYQIFDAKKDQHLDDLGWTQAKNFKKLVTNDTDRYGLYLVAIKGDWPTMNPLDKHFNHPNTKLLSEWEPEEIRNLIPNVI